MEQTATARALDHLTTTATGDILGGRMAASVTEHRVRPVVERAVRHAYELGRHEAVRELATTEEVAAMLGILPPSVRRLAQQLGVGWQVSRGTWLFRPEDVEALSQRNIKRGPKPRGGHG